jgi:aryl-alcohol dehydrogenase-like predicted oxidoreductase
MHDVVKAGKARYIGASNMAAWQFARALYVAELHGWTRFATMQDHLNLLYREEEREMLPLCRAEGVGVIPWSPMARGRLTRNWDETSGRQETDEFGKTLYTKAFEAGAAETGGHCANHRGLEARASRRRRSKLVTETDSRRNCRARRALRASSGRGLIVG